MYAKLSIRNAKRSAKDYMIYFITLTLCVSLFYGFTTLSSESCEITTGDQFDFTSMYTYIKYLTYFITAVLAILVGYVNKYIMKRRKREFATYILLGTEQKYVALMFFVETLIMGVASIVVGIFLGNLISQGLTALVLMTCDQEITFSFRFYMDTIRNTFIFFIGMFCVIGLFNIRTLNKTKLIDMFNDNKKVEKEFKNGEIIYGILGAFSVISYIYSAIGINKFITVCKIGTTEFSEKKFWICSSLIAIVIGTYTLFYSISYVIIFIKKRCTNIKYKYTNLFFLGNLLGRIRSNPIGLATITLTLLGAMLGFTLTIVMGEWSEGYLNYRVAYDVNLHHKKFIDNANNNQFEKIVDYMKGSEFGLEDFCELEMYYKNEEATLNSNMQSTEMGIIGLEDYNKLRKMAGYKEITLKENEFAMQWSGVVFEEDIEEYIGSNDTLEINGQTLNISDHPYYRESIGESPYEGWSDAIIVVNDQVCKDLKLSSVKFYADSQNKMSHEFSEKLLGFIENWYKEEFHSDNYRGLYHRVKVYEANNILGLSLAMKTLGIYGGTILLVICLTVLALQQLSDSIEHGHRFGILNKLGIDIKEINRIILKQIGVYFGLPMIIAVIGFSIIIKYFSNIFAMPVHAFIGNATFKVCIGASLTIMIIVYVSYFAATYYTFKRNVAIKK